ncbi:hypothetical protein [Porphyromonas sp.]
MSANVSSQMTEVITTDDINQYLAVFDKYRGQIDYYMSLLKEEHQSNIEDIKGEIEMACLDLDPDKDLLTESSSASQDFLKGCDLDLRILINSLSYIGRDVKQKLYKLADSPILAKEEFVIRCCDFMKDRGFSFGVGLSELGLNFESKVPQVRLECLEEALSILDVN